MANPDRNKHLLSIFFGTLPHETQDQNTLDEQGVITPNAHPWTRQLGDDLEEMLKAVDDAHWLDTHWQPRNMLALFQDEETREAFVNIDVTAMRARFLSYEWSPHGEQL